MNIRKIFKIMSIVMLIIMLLAIPASVKVFAAGNCAFSAGYGYGDVNMSDAVKKAATKYGSMGYSSYYATETANFSVLSGTFANGIKRLESDIVFLTGHGASTQVSTLSAQGLIKGNNSGVSNYVGTNTVSWNKVKLAIFLACETGKGDGI